MCGMNADCTNTIGSYMCSCSSGYTGDGTMCTGECKCCFFVQLYIHTVHMRMTWWETCNGNWIHIVHYSSLYNVVIKAV